MSAKSPCRSSRRLGTALFIAALASACGTPGGNDSGSELQALERSPEGAAAMAPGSPRPAPATAWVIFGADTVVAEVARTEDERAQGLMHREALDENAGMLFVFPESSVRSFWMQNTYIPLDIAFMDPAFRIVDIQQMEPMTTDSHTSRGPAMYALEVNKGWFEAHGISVGDTPEVVFGS